MKALKLNTENLIYFLTENPIGCVLMLALYYLVFFLIFYLLLGQKILSMSFFIWDTYLSLATYFAVLIIFFKKIKEIKEKKEEERRKEYEEILGDVVCCSD